MNHILKITLGTLIVLLSACGEDRSGEYYALIEDKMWIEETMQKHYLWYDQMPVTEKEADYFKEAETFFKNLLYKKALNGKGDNYSYMEYAQTDEATRAIAMLRESTYGMEFELVNDPSGTTAHTYAHVLYTLPDSPAEKAGIQRGDWITSISGYKITSDNYNQLQYGNGVRISITQMVNTENGMAWQPADTVNIAPSIQMEISPFLIDSVYEAQGKKIAYLMYNEFATGPKNDSTETVYNEQMKQIFTRFKAQSPDAFILDLRYNTGGYLHCAQALGSLLAPSSTLGKDFIKLQFNDLTKPQVKNYPFSQEYASANLDLDKIYILTGSYTASASEALIYGLIPHMGAENVVLLGGKTEGKNVAMTGFWNKKYNFTIWPVVAYVFNADDQGDYYEGITPQHVLNEKDYSRPWYPLGDTREYLLENALNLICNGTLPEENQTNNHTKTIRSTIGDRSLPGIRIQ